MWTKFKSAITASVEKYVPTKMYSTRKTHPWINTTLGRAMRRKQQAHWRAKKTKDWARYLRQQAEVQKLTQTSEKKYMEEVVGRDLKKDPKQFYSYIKSKKQESKGVSSLINKHGFLQSKSTKRADILNNQFESAYTCEDTNNISNKGPSQHPSMRRIIFKPDGIAKLLRNLKPHKASGPDSNPYLYTDKRLLQIRVPYISQSTSASTNNVLGSSGAYLHSKYHRCQFYRLAMPQRITLGQFCSGTGPSFSVQTVVWQKKILPLINAKHSPAF